jgi:hypothetical protein
VSATTLCRGLSEEHCLYCRLLDRKQKPLSCELISAVQSLPGVRRRVGSISERSCEAQFTWHIKGMRHAERPKQKHEHAPTLDVVICAPLTGMGIKRASPSPEGFSQCAKKLRALSSACPSRSPGRQYDRRGELLPTRRTLFQVDVRGLSSAFMRCSARNAASSARLRCSASRKIA